MEKLNDTLIEKLARIKLSRAKLAKPVDREITFANFQQKLKRQDIELKMRKQQLKTATKELEEARVETEKLRYLLQTIKHNTHGYQENMKALLDNNKDIEQKIKDCVASEHKASRQNSITKCENETLRTRLCACEADRYNLKKTTMELKATNVLTDRYQKEIEREQMKIIAIVNKIKNCFKKFEADRKVLMAETKDMEVYRNTLQRVDVLTGNIKSLQQKNNQVEMELVILKATHKELLKFLGQPTFPLESETEKYFYKQWTDCVTKFQEYKKMQDQITLNLIQQLKSEKETNTKLILSHGLLLPEEHPKTCPALAEVDNSMAA